MAKKKRDDTPIAEMTGEVVRLPTNPQKIKEFEVPLGYEVWLDGIYKLPEDINLPAAEARWDERCPRSRLDALERVSYSPVWIEQTGYVADTGEILLQLAFVDTIRKEVATVWVTRFQIASKNKLVELAGCGLPVNESTAPPLMAYLNRAVHRGTSQLPMTLMHSRAGAVRTDKGWGFLLGSRWIGPEDTKVTLDPRKSHPLIEGFKTSGNEEDWKQMMRTVIHMGPVARWLVYSNYAATLLRFIPHRSLLIHHWSGTGTGKSAILKFAMSNFGNTEQLFQSHNRTFLSYAETFNYVTDLPVAFDELQAATSKNLDKVVYALTQEKGRERVMAEGGLERTVNEWSSVIRMTGEEPLIGKDGNRDLGGQSNRMIQLGAPALNDATARSIHTWVDKRCYGWGGLRFVERLVQLLNSENGIQSLQTRFGELKDGLQQQVSTLLAAHAGYFAVIAMAQAMANEWFFELDPEDAMEEALKDALTVAELVAAEERPEQVETAALQVFHDHMHCNRWMWKDVTIPLEAEELRSGSYRQLAGVVTESEIWIIQRVANKILEDARLPSRRVWSDLQRAGILLSGKKGYYATKKSAGRFSSKCYVLSRVVGLDNPFT